MGYNSGTGELTKPFTKIAANGSGDLQRALGRSVLSEIQLVGDVDSNGNPVNAVHIESKFKPFKDSTVAFSGSGVGSDRETALQNTNLGYIIPSSTYRNLSGVFQAAVTAGVGAILWQWDKPVAGTNPLRALDFDRYNNQCDWPYQVGINPNPAYYSDRTTNSIRVSDEHSSGGPGSWDYTDLKKALPIPGGSTINISSAFGTSVWLAVAWAPVGQTTPTGAFTLKNGARYIITPPTADTSYNVLAFFTNVEYTGSVRPTDGIHIPVPKALSRWEYHHYLPFVNNGTNRTLGTAITVKLRTLQTISYQKLGVKFKVGSTWSETKFFYTTSGTLNAGDLIDEFVRVPTGFENPDQCWIVWTSGGVDHTDTRPTSISYNPT